MRPVSQGFALAELLVATAVLAVFAMGMAMLARLAADSARVQPETTDADQRLRAGLEMLRSRLGAAGLGSAVGAGAGPLNRRVPVVFPHRRTPGSSDPELGAFEDRFTVLSVPYEGTLVAVSEAMGSTASTIRVTGGAGCPTSAPACRFSRGMRAVVFDTSGAHDLFLLAGVDADTLQPSAPLSRVYTPALGAAVVPVEVRSVYFDVGLAQLRTVGGSGVSAPALDHVVGLRVRYLGDARPPPAPRPPLGLEGCLFDQEGATRLPELPPTWGTLVELTPAMLGDGPVCGSAPHRFDADIFRIRALRVTLRVAAPSPSLRGSDPLLFRRPGSAANTATVPDREATIDVAPANLRDGG